MTLIGEAVQAGARERLACRELAITQRTLQRWRSDQSPLEDQRPHVVKRSPSHKLSEPEVQQILEVINQAEFKSLPPSEIVPRLADQGIYLASESTFYRVMHQHSKNIIADVARSLARNLLPVTVPQNLIKYGCGILRGCQVQ